MNGEPREAAKVYVAERVVSTVAAELCGVLASRVTPGAIAADAKPL